MTEILCKICAYPTTYIGAVNFNKNCAGREFTPKIDTSVGHVHYYQCVLCKFLFTPTFDSWTPEDWKERVYNKDYDIIDPEFFTGERARRNASVVMRLIPPTAHLLDYGGGDGKLFDILSREGFPIAYYDMVWAGPILGKNFDFITCFEVLEHSTNPYKTTSHIASLLSPTGTVFFSTHTLGTEYEREGLEWWYVGPRNGHVSIFSPEALRKVWSQIGFNLISITPNRHFAQRKAQ